MVCDLIIMLFCDIFMRIISMFVVLTTLNLSDIDQI